MNKPRGEEPHATRLPVREPILWTTRLACPSMPPVWRLSLALPELAIASPSWLRVEFQVPRAAMAHGPPRRLSLHVTLVAINISFWESYLP
jgi:hypothetical protein